MCAKRTLANICLQMYTVIIPIICDLSCFGDPTSNGSPVMNFFLVPDFFSSEFWSSPRRADRQTDGQTDRQTESDS